MSNTIMLKVWAIDEEGAGKEALEEFNNFKGASKYIATVVEVIKVGERFNSWQGSWSVIIEYHLPTEEEQANLAF